VEATHEVGRRVVVRGGGSLLAVYRYGDDTPKPYFHPVTLGTGLEAPLTLLSPHDHVHHRGLWFCWKFVNGENFWEERPTCHRVRTTRLEVDLDTRDRVRWTSELRWELERGEALFHLWAAWCRSFGWPGLLLITLQAAATTADDVAFWLYSSGSTGKPKGVVHLQHDIGVTCETYARQVLALSGDDVTFSTTKLFHAYGLGNGLSFPFWSGATAVLMRGPTKPEPILETLRRHRPSVFFSVPALFGAIVRDPGADGALESVRFCVSAAEPLPAATFERWRERFGIEIVDGIAHFLSASAGEHLRRLSGAFEQAWCTGWEEKANEYLPRALGLAGPLPYLAFDGATPTVQAHWKLAAIDRFAGPSRPLAWIDDAHDERSDSWAAARRAPTLLVRSDPTVGLSEQHVVELLGWAKSLGG